jgi:hypothetical protein
VTRGRDPALTAINVWLRPARAFCGLDAGVFGAAVIGFENSLVYPRGFCVVADPRPRASTYRVAQGAYRKVVLRNDQLRDVRSFG